MRGYNDVDYAQLALKEGIRCPTCYEISIVDEVHYVSRTRLDLRKAEIDEYCKNCLEDNEYNFIAPTKGSREYNKLVQQNAICPKCGAGSNYYVWLVTSFDPNHTLWFPYNIGVKPKSLEELEALK
jgi:hypothetical protein